jgi:hypothetical protein
VPLALPVHFSDSWDRRSQHDPNQAIIHRSPANALDNPCSKRQKTLAKPVAHLDQALFL